MFLKTFLFAAAFGLCALGALYAPILGVIGYIGHYQVGPEVQWWNAPLSGLGVRYAYTLALLTAVGAALHYRRLEFGKFFRRQELLALAFLALVWISTGVSPATEGRYTVTDHPSVKMTKILIFAFLLSHIATRLKKLDYVLWAFVGGALILGLQAYDTPRRAFISGRLENVGGADFREAGGLGGYMAAVLPLVAVMFIRTRWWGRLLCTASAVFAMNTIILTRSRSAVLGLVMACVTFLLLAPKRYRVPIIALVVVGAAAFIYLTDPQFVQRAETILSPRESRDAASRSRLEIWKAGLAMIRDHPILGVGTGNFPQATGRYAPEYEGMNAHSTYIRCAAELGIPGLLLLLALIANAFYTLWVVLRGVRVLPESQARAMQLVAVGLGASLASSLAFGITGHQLYVEAFWWKLLLPVCLLRCFENARADLQTNGEAESMPPQLEHASAESWN